MNKWLDRVGEKNPEKAVALTLQMMQFVFPKLVNQNTQYEDVTKSAIDYSKMTAEELDYVTKIMAKYGNVDIRTVEVIEEDNDDNQNDDNDNHSNEDSDNQDKKNNGGNEYIENINF